MGIEPSYEQKSFDPAGCLNQLQLVACPHGQDRSLTIHAVANIYLLDLDGTESVPHEMARVRNYWIQVLRGEAAINGYQLDASDGAAISDASSITLETGANSETMLFDLPYSATKNIQNTGAALAWRVVEVGTTQ